MTGSSASSTARDGTRSNAIKLVCGHYANDEIQVVIKPSGKLKYVCPSGCGLQPAH